MRKATDFKRYGEELGDILALMETINRYQSVGKKSSAKTTKQNDKPLLKLLKTQYVLSENEMQEIMKVVSGKKAGSKQTKAAAVSEADRASLKKEIDATIAKVGITIRAQNLSEETYLKKIKANLSVRKGKIMAVLHPTREKRVRAQA